ncbi:MAG: hypothetical protein AAF705_09665 [Bacteroidota bacterium]
MDRNLLDNELAKVTGFKPRENEALLWSSRPRLLFSTALTNMLLRSTSMSFLALLELVFFIFLISELSSLYNGVFLLENWNRLGICGAVIFISEAYQYYKGKATKYFISNQRIVLVSWSGFKPTYCSMEFKVLVSVNYEKYRDKLGTIFLMIGQDFRFKATDFFSIEKRNFPTFELISNCVDLFELIKAQQLKLNR